jgi:hypothetical protein
MYIHLKIAGVLLTFLALIHVFFPRYFGWRRELRLLSLINRQMMKVHTFFIALVVLLMGLLCITSAGELIETKLGHRLAFGLAVFWTIRLLIQFFGYSSRLWRGRRFETLVHIVLSLFWAYFSYIFWSVAVA